MFSVLQTGINEAKILKAINFKEKHISGLVPWL